MTAATTGFLIHERYVWHATGAAVVVVPAAGFVQPMAHAETPDSKRRLGAAGVAAAPGRGVRAG